MSRLNRYTRKLRFIAELFENVSSSGGGRARNIWAKRGSQKHTGCYPYTAPVADFQRMRVSTGGAKEKCLNTGRNVFIPVERAGGVFVRSGSSGETASCSEKGPAQVDGTWTTAASRPVGRTTETAVREILNPVEQRGRSARAIWIDTDQPLSWRWPYILSLMMRARAGRYLWLYLMGSAPDYVQWNSLHKFCPGYTEECDACLQTLCNFVEEQWQEEWQLCLIGQEWLLKKPVAGMIFCVCFGQWI